MCLTQESMRIINCSDFLTFDALKFNFLFLELIHFFVECKLRLIPNISFFIPTPVGYQLNVTCLPLSLSPFTAFKNLVGDQAIFQKAIFVLGNLAVIGLAIYKFHSMGLLPTYQSDWLEFQEPQKVNPPTKQNPFDCFPKPV